MRSACLLLLILAVPLSAPAADTGDELRRFFEATDAGAAPLAAGRELGQPALLARLYRDRDHQPLWSAGGPLAGRLGELLQAIEDSTAHGLNQADYHLATLQRLQADPAAAAALELLASDAFLLQVRHRSIGAVSPRELDPEWHLIPPEVDALAAFGRLIDSTAPVARELDRLWPDSGEYRELVQHRARILALGEVTTTSVPAGPLLKPGQSGPRIIALKDRLLGPADHTDLFDDDLRVAVTRLQLSAGLEPDGIVGDATLEVLNATRFSWVDRIDANLERMRWLPREQPHTYVRVNIAAYSLRVIQAGEDALAMDVIVGRPYRRTPVFSENIRYLVLNPYWNVPFKIATQDKLPLLKDDPAALDAQGYEVRPNGETAFRPVAEINWLDINRRNFDLLLRQRPGPANALGQIKFMLPNPHAVYLHDTPSRDLFARQERSFSSGCVRLSQPMELARWLLTNDGNSDTAANLSQIVAGGETRTVYLTTPVPAHLVYLTAFTDAAGEVVFRRDIYGRDAALVAALRKPSNP